MSCETRLHVDETDLSSLKMAMLLVQSDSLVLLAPTISVINVGQFRGHSCFTIYNVCVRTKYMWVHVSDIIIP